MVCAPAETDEADVVVGEARGGGYIPDRMLAVAGLRPGADGLLMLRVTSQLGSSSAAGWVMALVAVAGEARHAFRATVRAELSCIYVCQRRRGVSTALLRQLEAPPARQLEPIRAPACPA